MASLSLNTVCWTSLFTRAVMTTPEPMPIIKLSRLIIAKAYSTSAANDPEPISDRRATNYSGVKLQETVDVKSEKLRLDSWVSSRITGISRARVQSSIRSGLVSVNGRIINKVSHMVRGGDTVNCTIAELQPLRAGPEDIALDIVYEDDHVLVVNKPAHMVVHPAPGSTSGTLVNGILHHCSLPMLSLPSEEVLSEAEDASDEEFTAFPRDPDFNGAASPGSSEASVRPGIVHRLDKGTSGLLVVAKDEHSHAHLAEQFKKRTIKRVYISLTCGVPSPVSGRVDVPVGRDSNNRIRMAAIPGSSISGKSRNAASRYRVIEVLAGGGSALVEWRLETGRTHQIRVHAKHLGVPLLGDELYGGTKGMALSLLQPGTPPIFQENLQQLIYRLERPCLHALSLGFIHPYTLQNMHFSQMPPADFAEILYQLRDIRTEKVDDRDAFILITGSGIHVPGFIYSLEAVVIPSYQSFFSCLVSIQASPRTGFLAPVVPGSAILM